MFTLINILVFFASVVAVIIAYYKWQFQYWQRRNFPYLTPSFPFGNSTNPLRAKEQVGFRLKRHYDKAKAKGWKHCGLFLFSRPSHLVVDLDYAKKIMTKDFQYFAERGMYHNEKDDPLSAHLFAIDGQKWRRLRTALTPTFTSGKMKAMFNTVLECTPNLLEKIEEDCLKNKAIDVRDVLARFTTDVIGSCAFGIECNTFKEESSPFREYGQKAINLTPMQNLKMIFAMVFPRLATRLGVSLFGGDMTDFFVKLVKDTIDYRKNNNITRQDFMQLLLSLTDLTLEEITAQAFVFFLAGFETSSATMTFLLYELSRNPAIQDKVRNEIKTVLEKHDNKITYEAIQELKYLDQVIDETLRMYPPLTMLSRRSVQDYKIEGEDLVLEKGTNILIPVLPIHYDPEYYPNPEKFDPERFTEENKMRRHHYAHLPFGEGPRNCIGMRFGLMQSKVGLTSLLKTYKFTVDQKTKQPLKMLVHSLTLAPEGKIFLNAQRI